MLEPDHLFVSTAQMQRLEQTLFDHGMPVAALMEKAAGLVTQYLEKAYPRGDYPQVSILVGPGHNGGDALVIARELHLAGYQVQLLRPLPKLKPLTKQHWCYANFLGIPQASDLEQFLQADLIIDGLFGFGLTRPIEGSLAQLIEAVNTGDRPIVSIDLPSGLDTDTGLVLGTAIRATESLCLGLWKRCYGLDLAMPYLGKVHRFDFGIPSALIQAQLQPETTVQGVSKTLLQQSLPLRRSPLTHKYKQGHLLLVGGSQTYAGSILLAALGARATGVGMLTLVVPESLKRLIVAQVPEAIVIGVPEDETGAIAYWPELNFSRYQAIACGCGLTLRGAENLLPSLISQAKPLILDADALNWLARDIEQLQKRTASTILTPHAGEFKRLFGDRLDLTGDRFSQVQAAAKLTDAVTLLKGAKTIIAASSGMTHCVMDSTPALARGGSGDVLLGVMGGLLAQTPGDPLAVATVAAWWHAQAALHAEIHNGLAGVDGVTLSRFLPEVLRCHD